MTAVEKTAFRSRFTPRQYGTTSLLTRWWVNLQTCIQMLRILYISVSCRNYLLAIAIEAHYASSETDTFLFAAKSIKSCTGRPTRSTAGIIEQKGPCDLRPRSTSTNLQFKSEVYLSSFRMNRYCRLLAMVLLFHVLVLATGLRSEH